MNYQNIAGTDTAKKILFWLLLSALIIPCGATDVMPADVPTEADEATAPEMMTDAERTTMMEAFEAASASSDAASIEDDEYDDLLTIDDTPTTDNALLSDGKDPTEGCWIATNQRTGKYLCGWQFYVQDGTLYARILSATGATAETYAYGCRESYPGYESDVPVNTLKMFGTTFIWGLKQVRPGVWKGGYVIDPDSGNFYRCSIKYRAADGKRFKRDVLEMRGSLVWFRLLGLTQYWPAATYEEAASIE